MGVKPAAVAALFAAAFASAPSNADDIFNPQVVPLTMVYMRIPLGGASGKESAPAYGLALQGRQPYETVMLDSRMFNFAEGLLAGIEAKWLIAGGLALAGGVYLSHKDKKRSDDYSASQNQQQNSAPPPPPPCDPCKK